MDKKTYKQIETYGKILAELENFSFNKNFTNIVSSELSFTDEYMKHFVSELNEFTKEFIEQTKTEIQEQLKGVVCG